MLHSECLHSGKSLIGTITGVNEGNVEYDTAFYYEFVVVSFKLFKNNSDKMGY